MSPRAALPPPNSKGAWPAPAPDDDGVSLLAQTLLEVAGATGRSQFVDATPLIRTLRLLKSGAEIDKITHICDIVSRA